MMLKTARMEKVQIFSIDSAVPAVIKQLHELGVVEIRRSKATGLEEGRPLPVFDEISENLVKMRAVISALGLTGHGELKHVDAKKLFAEAKQIDGSIGSKVRELVSRKNESDDKIKQISAKLSVISRLTIFKDVRFDKLKTKYLTYAVGELPTAKILHMKSRLESAVRDYELVVPEQKSATSVALLIYPRDAEIDVIFAESGFSSLPVPEETSLPIETEHALKNEISENKKRIHDIEKELHEIAAKHGKELLSVFESLLVESDRAEIASNFASSKRIFIIQGWLKAADFNKLEHALTRFGNSIVLQKADVDEHEQPPIILDNPGYAKPFAFITENYSLPNYFEIDPTMIYLVTLSFVYGMIIGDVFYGILSIIIAMWFMKIFAKSYIMSNVSKIWYYAAFPAILFGVIFDEWGGLTHKQWFDYLNGWGLPGVGLSLPQASLYLGLSRVHEFQLILGLTLLIGFIHVALGFILGVINTWGHHRKHAYAKISWLLVEIGGTAAICTGLLGVLPASLLMPFLAVLVIGLVGLLFTDGVIGMLELPGLVGNILSYARIAALGVVGVAIAEIINEFFLPTASSGLMVVILIPIFVVLHMANTFIAMFEALVQGGRLNIVEFRAKFLEGGGILFSPFMLKSKMKK